MFHVRPSILILFFISIALNVVLYIYDEHPLFKPKQEEFKLEFRHMLIVFDMNDDKIISTTPLEKSWTSFDLTNSGFRARSSWINSTEAILVFDKNKNRKIEGIKEAFNDKNISGFDYLKHYIDSNKDKKIDSKDPLFHELQIWIDYNQNGIAEKYELRNLEAMDITSISLKYEKTNIKTNKNTITKTSYYEQLGKKKLAAEINLDYNPRFTSIDFSQIENFSIRPSTLHLPIIRGYGFFADTSIAYQLNPNLEKIAETFIKDPALIYNEFDQFINEWSGYNAFKRKIAQTHNLAADIHMHELDRRLWIMEKTTGGESLTDMIEENYENLAKNITSNETITLRSINGITRKEIKGRILLKEDYINEHYFIMLRRTQSIFALGSYYKEPLTSITYSVGTDSIQVKDYGVLYANVKEYFNNQNIPLSSKLYLAKTICILNQTQALNFNVSTFLDSLDNNPNKSELEKALTTGII